MDACLLHCINHIALSAAAIKKNNERIKAGDFQDGDTPRDQGFTRAKVRVPFRSAKTRKATYTCYVGKACTPLCLC